MSIESFAKGIRDRLNETFNYGNPQDTPIAQAQFPELPSAANQTLVTVGETKPIDEPRDDIAMQKQGGEVNSEVIAEISSLLVSIGYILSKESVVPDKFNIPAVLDFLNTHFKQADPVECSGAVQNVVTPEVTPNPDVPPIVTPEVNTTEPVEGADPLKLTYANKAVNAFMESRLKFHKNI